MVMRDDEKVRRFHLNPSWLKAALSIFVLMVVIAFLGLYFAHHYWNKSKTLITANEELEQELQKTGKELESVKGERDFYMANDPDKFEALLNTDAHMGNATQAGDNSTESAAAAVVEGTAEGNRTEAVSVTGLSDILAAIDTGQLQVEEFTLRKNGEKNFRIDFNLVNMDQAKALAGKVEVKALASDGRLVDMVVNNPRELTFQIQRFKTITIQLSTPGDLKPEDIFGLRLIINNTKGSPQYSVLYQLSGWLSS